MVEINKLIELHDKYNFDYIYINPDNISDFRYYWKYIAEEMNVDFTGPKDYLGTIQIVRDDEQKYHGTKSPKDVEVYQDKKITPGDVIFKFKNIQEERKVKLINLYNS